mmetsp:Transcript_12791/g.23825  ORF Transcript_12791/g.23825 Transcript_12791/m.23825 type:complete len:295 (+) Transcript_12791:101-985(+)
MSGLILPFDWSKDMHVLDDDLLTSYLNSQSEIIEKSESESFVKLTQPRKATRLERNREAARVSRLRKKEQLRSLEENLAALTEELNTLRNEEPVNFSSDRELLALFTAKDKQNHEDLRVAKEQSKRHKLREAIDEAQQQFGITGAERQGIIHFFFQQIKSNVAPDYVKDLLEVCTNGPQLSQNWGSLESYLELDAAQTSDLRRQRKKLSSLGVQFTHCMRRFKRIQKSLARRACAYQGQFDTVTESWSQTQLAEFLACNTDVKLPSELWKKKKSRRSAALQKRLKAEADLMSID